MAGLVSLGDRRVLAFRDELQRAAEYSEPGLPGLGAIIQELVAQPMATLPARHLQGSGPVVLRLLGDTISMDGLGERWPWRRVCVLGAAGEQLVAALGANVDA